MIVDFIENPERLSLEYASAFAASGINIGADGEIEYGRAIVEMYLKDSPLSRVRIYILTPEQAIELGRCLLIEGRTAQLTQAARMKLLKVAL